MALQNMKAQLREEFSLEEIIELVVNLQAVDDIIRHILKGEKSGEKGKNIQRCVQEYVNNQEQLQSQEYVSQELKQYFTKEALNKEQLKKLVQFKETEYQKLFSGQEGKTEEEMLQLKQKMDRMILERLRDDEMDSQMQNMVTYKSKKYFEVTYDLDTLMQDRKGEDYRRELDYQLVAEDDEIQLENKRVECEHNLAKLRIILKQAQGIELQTHEMDFLTLWQERSKQGMGLDITRSHQTISQLSIKDKNILEKFRFSGFSFFQEYEVNEIFMELQNAFSMEIVKEKDLEF